MQNHLGRAKGTGEFGVPPSVDAIHSIAEHRGEAVLAIADLLGHVVGGVETRFAIVGPSGIENMIAHFAPVESQLVLAESADGNDCPANRFRRVELASQQRKPVGAVLCGRPDPFGIAARRIQQSHCPGGRFAPRRRLPVAIPRADLPPALLARAELAAAVRHLDRFVRNYFAAVPQIALIPIELLPRAGYEYLVGRLAHAPSVGVGRNDDPTEPRLVGIDSQRVLAVLAAQLRRLDVGGAEKCLCRANHRQEHQRNFPATHSGDPYCSAWKP